jgi:hypothetical protein
MPPPSDVSAVDIFKAGKFYAHLPDFSLGKLLLPIGSLAQ